MLEAPQSVGDLGGRGAGRALVVKEMTFQVGDAFALLADLATRPIVFLIRDPRLTIASRMKVLRRSGRPQVFPLRESGWEDLARQLAYVRREGIPHLVVDSSELRRAPARLAPALLGTLGLRFTPDLLRWQSSEATGLSAVSGADDPFYRRVLDSQGMEPPAERIPDLTEFPTDGGFREHVAECVAQYEEPRARAEIPALNDTGQPSTGRGPRAGRILGGAGAFGRRSLGASGAGGAAGASEPPACTAWA